MNIEIESNTIYQKIAENQSFFLLLYGGAGSAKSHETALDFLTHIMETRNERILMIRKHYKHVRQSQFQLFKTLINRYNLGNNFLINETDMRIKCKQTGSELIAFGVDDPEKLKSFTEPTKAWIEEMTELEEEDFDIIAGRIRSPIVPYLQIKCTFNPIDKKHWIKERFFKDYNVQIGEPFTYEEEFEFDYNGVKTRERVATTILWTTYQHNRFLDSKWIAWLLSMKEKNPEYYKVYALGEWGDLEQGLIFKRDYYKEYNSIPADAKGVVYCDPNLSKKDKGDSTAIIKLLFSPSNNAYYVDRVICRNMSDSNELLNYLIEFRSDNAKYIGLDGNVSQESTWKQHIENYCKINQKPFPIIDFKRYRVDDLAKNAQILWNSGAVYFPPNFRFTEEGERFLNQLYAFNGKKFTKSKDDAPDAFICAIEYIVESGLGYANKYDLSNLKLYR